VMGLGWICGLWDSTYSLRKEESHGREQSALVAWPDWGRGDLGARRRGVWRPAITPKMKKRTALLQKLKDILRSFRSHAVRDVIGEINPIIAGWVNYFRVGHSSRCLRYVSQWVERKIRRHMMRSRARHGFGWKRWSKDFIYGTLGLYKDYRVRYLEIPKALTAR